MEVIQAKASEKPRPKLSSSLRIGRREMDYNALAELGRRKPRAFARFVQEKIDVGEFRWDNVSSLPHLFAALADVEVPVDMPVAPGVNAMVTTSAFPLVTGQMSIARFNQAYDLVPTIGQELVSDFDDNKKLTILARLIGLDNVVGEVPEGQDFPMVSATEDGAVITHRRNGRRLAITAETLEENDVAGFVRLIDKLADFAASAIEYLTIERVIDLYGSGSSPTTPYVYRPLGNTGGTTLYSTTANTPNTRAPSGTRLANTALVDDTSLNAARTLLTAMRDDNGRPIAAPPSQCLLVVPEALLATGLKWLGSELVPGEENSLNIWGPRGQMRPGRVVSSAVLDRYSTNAWYYGRPQQQFMRKWKLRWEYVTLSGNTQRFLEARVAMQARIAWDCEVGADDCVNFVQCLSGTTPPAAP